MTDEKKVPEKKEDKYVLKEIITATDVGIGLKDEEGIFTDKGILVELLNKLDRIEKYILSM